MNVTRKPLLILFVFLSSLSLFAEKKYIYAWGRKWSTTDEKKFDLKKKSASIMIPHVWCCNRIDFCNTFSMARGTDHHDYNVNTGPFNRGDHYFSFYIFNRENNILMPIYTLNSEDNCYIEASFYKDGYIYSLESEFDIYKGNKRLSSPLYITKRTTESKTVIKKYPVSYFRTNIYEYFTDMYVDEENNKLFFICDNKSKYPLNEIKIFSLVTGDELFSHQTYSTLLIDAGYVYYSEQNRLFKVNYTEEEFKPVEVKSFLSKKEQILSINKYDDLYIVRARHPGFNPINKFLFGHHPSIYTEYVCKLKDNELIKIKELKEP